MRYWKLKSINDNPKVGVVLVTYNQVECLQSLICCLKTQTWQNFQVIVSHDGPASNAVKAGYKAVAGDDTRFTFVETAERANKFGHERRYPGFVSLMQEGADYLCTTNADCWYTPNYFESMLYEMQATASKLVYCNMIHSHRLWQPLVTTMKKNRIDVGCWMAHKSLVEKVDWTDFSFTGDWSFIHKLHKVSDGKQVKVEGYLYVHN